MPSFWDSFNRGKDFIASAKDKLSGFKNYMTSHPYPQKVFIHLTVATAATFYVAYGIGADLFGISDATFEKNVTSDANYQHDLSQLVNSFDKY